LSRNRLSIYNFSDIFKPPSTGEKMNNPSIIKPLQDAKLTQIGIVVRNVDEAARKFSALTGMPAGEAIITDTVDKAHTVYRGKSTPARAKLIFFNMGQVTIEFIEPMEGPSTWREFLEKHGNGLHHIAFNVANTAKTAAAMESQGCRMEQKGDYTGGNYIYVDAAASIGAIVELLQND
jgi:catechol 2,3-dioxygenase-like lactoylglutathione lyase family enzyme